MSAGNISLEALRVLLDANDDASLRDVCEAAHPAALAECLEDLPLDDVARVLRLLPPEPRAEALGHLEGHLQRDAVELLSDDELAQAVTAMLSDDRVDLLKELPEDRVEGVLRRVAKAEREDILKLGSYEEGTAGAIMTSEYVSLTPDLTVREALDKLRKEAPQKETIYYAYVVDQQRRLIGLVSLKDLILERPSARIGDIMHIDLVVARANDPQEEVAQKLSQYDLIAVPVINGNDALAGIVTFDDVLDVAEEEATADFLHMGATGSMRTSLKDASIWLLYRNRAPWLLVLVFVNIFSGAGIAFFESAIESMVALVFFLPLLIDSGGNAGSQSATLMVRALATGEVELRDWFRLILKEFAIGLTLALTMAVAVSMVSLYRAPEVAVVVALSMLLTVLVGSLIGMVLPFLLRRAKLDPAAASAPLITSIADIAGVFIYFSIATWYLGLAAAG